MSLTWNTTTTEHSGPPYPDTPLEKQPAKFAVSKAAEPGGSNYFAKAVAQQLREVRGQTFHFFKGQASKYDNCFQRQILA
jgi:hypothetical protein